MSPLQTYFTGSNNGKHICGCSVNNSCLASPQNNKCNCDTVAHIDHWQIDEGHVTNSTALPMTGFTYGFLQHQAKFSIGPLECFGAKDFGDPRDSCVAMK
jgi:hypothetical protein